MIPSTLPETNSALPASDNQFARSLAAKDASEAGNPLPFACRGCGQICCRNQDIFSMPPEVLDGICTVLARYGVTAQ